MPKPYKRTGSCAFQRDACCGCAPDQQWHQATRPKGDDRRWLKNQALLNRKSAGLRHLRYLENSTSEFELTQFPEMACPGVYLFRLKPYEAPRPKLFYGETAHHSAIDHGAAKIGVLVLSHAGKVPHKTAGKRVTGTGWIVRLFQREDRNTEDTVFIYQQRTVLAAFDDKCGRAHLGDVLRRAEQVVLVRKLACFRVINYENIDVFERFLQVVGSTLDPVVHRVEGNQFWPFRDLM